MGIPDHLTCLLRNLYTDQEALISHTSKVMLKILQARLQQYVNRELPDVQAGFGKGRGTRDQIANICWLIEKAREFQKNIYFCFFFFLSSFWLLLFFTLQYCIGFSIHQHESATGIHKFPLLNPLQPPSPYHPSGLSQCTSILYPASNLDWWFVSYMIYSFNAILPNHPALSLSHRVKKSVLYICVSFAISALLTMPQPLTVWITINWGKFWKRWEYQSTCLPLEKPICRSGSHS